MGVSGCGAVVKYLLVLLNFIFLAVGSLLAGLSIWCLMDPAQTVSASAATGETRYQLGLYVILAAGLLIFTVAIFGLCGSLNNSQCCLSTFFCLLTLCVVGEAAVVWWSVAHTSQLSHEVSLHMKNTVANEYGKNEGATAAIDAFQKGLACCGATGPSDYQASKYGGGLDDGGAMLLDLSVMSALKQYQVPPSCCVNGTPETLCETSRKLPLTAVINPMLHSTGCVNRIIELGSKYAPIVFGVLVAVLSLQVTALLLSVCLCLNISSSDRYKA